MDLPIGFIIGDVAHVAQYLGNRSLSRDPGLQLDDDDRAPSILRGDVDESRGYGPFRPVVDDLQTRLKLFNRPTQCSLQIALQSDELAAVVDRGAYGFGTRRWISRADVVVQRFAPKLAVSLDRVSVGRQIVSRVAIEWDL